MTFNLGGGKGLKGGSGMKGLMPDAFNDMNHEGMNYGQADGFLPEPMVSLTRPQIGGRRRRGSKRRGSKRRGTKCGGSKRRGSKRSGSKRRKTHKRKH